MLRYESVNEIAYGTPNLTHYVNTVATAEYMALLLYLDLMGINPVLNFYL